MTLFHVTLLLTLSSSLVQASEPSDCNVGENCHVSEEAAVLLQTKTTRDNKEKKKEQMLAGDGGEMAKGVSIKLHRADFSEGTVILTKPGTYMLEEDISFEPQPFQPSLDSEKYKQADGYFLGFFAAIAIQGDGITLDCQGHSIEMSEKMLRLQRFFSIIELGSRPFIPGQGPPPLAKDSMTPGPFIPASDVTIKNCVLGLSSHHGIHGNNVDGITILNTEIKDFEVGGISLNGASGITIKGGMVGPSLKKTFTAEVSQINFLDHMINVIGMDDLEIKIAFNNTRFTLRGEDVSAQNIFDKLNKEVRNFQDDLSGDFSSLAKTVVPDGSAMYGILIHKAGVAVGDFSSHPIEDHKSTVGLTEGTYIENVTVDGLELHPEAWAILKHKPSNKTVQGPAGAVFRAKLLEDANGHYLGNPLSDAMVALGRVVDQTAKEVAKQRLAEYYSAMYMPADILTWAEGGHPLDYSKFTVVCNMDAMSHFNKGVMGLRLAYQLDPVLKHVKVSNLVNRGEGDFKREICSTDASLYKGNNVFGIVYENTESSIVVENMSPGLDGDAIKQKVLYK